MEKEIILYKSPTKEMKKKQKYFPRSKKKKFTELLFLN